MGKSVRCYLLLVSPLLGGGSRPTETFLTVIRENELRGDHAAWLRWRLAKMDSSERVEWLIASLTSKEADPFEVTYEQAALATCGTLALEKSLQKVRQLLSLRSLLDTVSEQRRTTGIRLLLEVSAVFRDSRVERLLEECAQITGEVFATDAPSSASTISSGRGCAFTLLVGYTFQ